jgi:hypothetical protein
MIAFLQPYRIIMQNPETKDFFVGFMAGRGRYDIEEQSLEYARARGLDVWRVTKATEEQFYRHYDASGLEPAPLDQHAPA